MAKKKKPLHPDAPLLHPDHPRPVSRRDFIRQGLIAGSGVTLGGGVFSLFSSPRDAYAALSADIEQLAIDAKCPVGGGVNPNIPVICFDLAGGANIAGSNVLVGPSAQQDPMLSTAYTRLGIPDTSLPTDPANVNLELGLAFHAQSAMLDGILQSLSIGNRAKVDGIVIPARSDNDTGNNPHNPMYGLALAGATGDVVSLIGSRNSDSGANSMSPSVFLDPELRPSKVDRPSDVTGMVDTGDLTAILGKDDVTAVMESIARLSHKKLSRSALDTKTPLDRDKIIKDLVRCGYLDAADLADRFAGKNINPDEDPHIVMQPSPDVPVDRQIPQPADVTPIFTRAEFGDGEHRKTASVMKMVIDGHAGAGTITMGGFDYHTGERETGERRDRRAGRCIGACLEYASRKNTPLMVYVYSDGAVSSNGRIDPANGKGEWTSDNSSTAASFILVYRPDVTDRTQILTPGYQATRQIGAFSTNGSVITNSSPAANNVNQLANMVILNYMALNGNQNSYVGKYSEARGGETGLRSLFPPGVGHGLGVDTTYNNYVAFQPVP